VTSTEEVGQPPALPTVDTQPRRKGRAAKGAAKGATDQGGAEKGDADKGNEKGKKRGAATQDTGAKSSATP